ncbi:MAG: hypothetical protein H6560_28100 [Lewinellaceae bacterium]|nr:hypothetical protein [Lewinellaceae bacterium]
MDNSTGATDFTLVIGALFSWDISVQKDGFCDRVNAPCNIYTGSHDTSAFGSVMLNVTSTAISGYVLEDGYRYEISPAGEYEQSLPGNYYVLCKQPKPEAPPLSCSIEEEAHIELGLVIDSTVYAFHNFDKEEILQRSMVLLREAEDYFSSQGVTIYFYVREPIFRRSPDYDDAIGRIADGISGYWDKSRSCVPIDAILLFTGGNNFTSGETAPGLCGENYNSQEGYKVCESRAKTSCRDDISEDVAPS